MLLTKPENPVQRRKPWRGQNHQNLRSYCSINQCGYNS